MFSGTPGDWGVTQIVFTPDGQNLVSYGEDGRAKVWSVTATGLAELPSGLVFTGSGSLYGGISPDGKYLAIGDRNATVKVFDLPRSISDGAAVLQWTLSPQTIMALPDAAGFYLDAAEAAAFTRDLNYLVVGYYGGGAPDPNLVAVWELGAAPKVVQLVTLTAPERPWTGVTGSSATNALIGTEGRFQTDAGDPQVALAVLDVSPTGVTRAEVTASGYFDDMVFSPDGNSLAVGFDNGQVLLYDVSDKTTMALQSPPLIPEAAADMFMYGMAFSLDGNYFATGQWDYDSDTTSVKLLPVAQRPSQSIQKTIAYIPWSVAFAPSGLGLAIGERDDGVLLYCTP
jgi:WD40 repeat protein